MQGIYKTGRVCGRAASIWLRAFGEVVLDVRAMKNIP